MVLSTNNSSNSTITKRKKQQNKNITNLHDDKRDIFGRTLSYILCYQGSIAQILKDVNPHSYDIESGYTPLHILLSTGQFQKAFKLYQKWKIDMEYPSHKFGGHIFELYDRDGLNPLDLYNLTLYNNIFSQANKKNTSSANKWPSFLAYSDSKFDLQELIHHDYPFNTSTNKLSNTYFYESNHQPPAQSYATHILTLGSNVHYNLGTGNKDDRQNFFQLNINQLTNNTFPLNDTTFNDIHMNKYNSLVTTSDNQIYVTGNASRGRLGTGSNDTHLFQFTQLSTLPSDISINSISTSDHHTLLLSSSSSLSPSNKKFSSSSVYSWGWNSYYQLGYQTNNSSKSRFDENSFGSIPRRINFLENKNIKLISCSNIHSCAVSYNGEVYLWGLNVGQMGKISHNVIHNGDEFDYEGHKGYIITKPIIINLKHLTIEQVLCTEYATFIRSENNVLTVLVNNTIKTFKIPLAKNKNFKEIDPFTHFTKREIPNKVVDMKCSNKYGNNLCFKYECGRIGVITFKNESPQSWNLLNNNILPINLVWTPNFNFNSCLDFDVSYKGDIILVTLLGEILRAENLNNNFKFKKLHSNKINSGRVVKVSCNSTFGSFLFIKQDKSNIPILYREDEFVNYFAKYSPYVEADQNDKYMTREFKKENYCSSLIPKYCQYDRKSQTYVDNKEFTPNSKFDICFLEKESNKVLCYAHELILKIRCPHLMHSIENGVTVTSKNNSISLASATTTMNNCKTIIVGGSYPSVVKDVIHYLYTDEKPDNQRSNMILLELVNNALHFERLTDYLQKIFTSILHQDMTPENSLVDTIIELKDGTIYTHALILSSRSIYFKLATSITWCKKNSNGMFRITLTHISKEHFHLISSYLYGTSYAETLETILHGKKFSDCLSFLLTALEYCNELLLLPLRNYLEFLLNKYINQDTVFTILINAYNSKAHLLVLSCCWYILTSINNLFFDESIPIIDKYFDAGLWEILEGQFRHILNNNRHSETKEKPWYGNIDFNSIGLFKKDLEKFNEYFMSHNNEFLPVFDIKPPQHIDNKAASTANSRRRSLVLDHSKQQSIASPPDSQTHNKQRKSSSKTKVPEEVRNIWKIGKISDSVIEDDTSEEFITVKRKSRRKTSETRSKPHIQTPSEPQIKEGEVLLHAQEGEALVLLSLLTTKTTSEDIKISYSNISPSKDPLSSRSFGIFKKSNQKQRRHELTQDKQVKKDIENKPVWKTLNKEPQKNSRNFEKTKSTRSALDTLPSLLTTSSTEIKENIKKNKKKSAQNVKTESHNYTEFVSSGNPGGILPYITPNKIEVNEITAAFSNPNSNIVTSAEEKLAAIEFEKWFAKESAKVQKNLKKNKNNIEAIYGNYDTIPDFFSTKDSNKTKKKMKGRFIGKSKKNGLQDLNDLNRLL